MEASPLCARSGRESDIPCSGMDMVKGGPRIVDLTQLWAQSGLSARLSERRQRCGVRGGTPGDRRVDGASLVGGGNSKRHRCWEGFRFAPAQGPSSHWKLEITAF